jgi:hypothetical protein
MFYPHHRVYSRRDNGLHGAPEEIYQAAVMHAQGIPYTAIGKKLGFNNKTVAAWHRKGKFVRALQQRANTSPLWPDL